MSKGKTFILAVTIPLLILAAMAVKPQATLLWGQEILLETKAYDPTDLFRGDYVAVNFAITDVPKSKVPANIDKLLNKTLYVSLKQEGKYYVVDQVSENKPDSGIYLKSKFQNSFTDTDSYRVDYSLDKYFVEQGSGKELEEESFKGGLVGRVKVLGGYGVLTGIESR
ncbi:putative membrane-anchored protein [Desulfosporosinus orientis DSM 765]|uniref:Putative membrane-anchored protein n=1 Tax=Desulfosporosinus orientis (strain ATCC 19365 / DSM 765 / NCIMB 8382 / VKM B-1628 / Singapore I) TaxID=768706 RepID=G7WE17_DESOD|nr:GDYXXLXY domain-containing protein [Desulfosporosinus orientis]AET69415.1 putative membrane-anchored protein [Desulfosporosinus orientis DSM 765]